MKNQKGSAHIVIIIVLVVAVIGLLGFVFWQNFVISPKAKDAAKVASTQQAEQSAASANELTETEAISNDGVTLRFNYPKDWIRNETSSIEGTLTSADQTIQYNYSLRGLGGIGGTCGDPKDDVLVSLDWEKSSMNDDAIFAQYGRKYKGDGNSYYTYGFGLLADYGSTIRNSGVGDSGCVISVDTGFIKSGVINNDTEPIAVMFTGHFMHINNDGDASVTKSLVDAAFATDTFKAAKQIALSAKLNQ